MPSDSFAAALSHGQLTAPVSLIYSFLLVLVRIAGSMIFVPLPGFRNTPEPIRIILILAITLSLYPVWPSVPAAFSVVQFIGWIAIEAGFGLAIGLLVGFLADALLMFGQICGLQAGFSFASTIDPNTQADSPVLAAIAQSVGGLLFVTLGLHRYVIQVFAKSLESQAPGKLTLNPRWAELIMQAAGTIFSTGLRLALPIVALLAIVDITLALLGRINAHLQLLHLAMPLKILAALAAISLLLMLFPSFYSDYATSLFRVAFAIAR